MFPCALVRVCLRASLYLCATAWPPSPSWSFLSFMSVPRPTGRYPPLPAGLHVVTQEPHLQPRLQTFSPGSFSAQPKLSLFSRIWRPTTGPFPIQIRVVVSLLHQPAWSAVRTLQAAFVVTRTCRVSTFSTVTGPGFGAVLKNPCPACYQIFSPDLHRRLSWET